MKDMLPLEYFLPIDALLGLLAFFVSKAILERRAKRKEEEEEVVISSGEELDDKEKAVLEAIKNGAKTLNQVMKATGLPKATAYRKIKSLIKKGLVKVEIEDNKRVLKAKEEKKENQ